jgi:hypothetical protein
MAVRGAATKGAVARKVAGADDVELKATIPHDQIHRGLGRYKLTRNNDEERQIFFYDTPDLGLFNSGVVLRARRIIGGDHDSTVKLRPVDPKKVPPEWKKFPGFKIEADASEKGVVKSASLTMPVAKGVIKRVAAGELGVASLFTKEQKRFLRDVARLQHDFSQLLSMGPMRAQRWKFSDPALPWPITAELWRREDGALIFEASIKAPVEQAAVAGGGFLAHLAEIGAERDHGQEAKTRWALEHFAGKSRRKSSVAPTPAPAAKAGGKSARKRKAAAAKRKAPTATKRAKPAAAPPARKAAKRKASAKPTARRRA